MWRVLLVVAAAAAASDLDFEFADTAQEAGRRGGHYVVEPDALSLCGWRRCGSTMRCAVRRGRAVCVPRRPHRDRTSLQRLASGAGGGGCVSCEAAAAGAVCGSDNRTYASLCELDLRNCERRAARPARPARAVRPACHSPCPCHAAATCTGDALSALAARLLDWFSVLQRSSTAPPAALYPAGCLPEVRWMFAHLDVDGDGTLSRRDLHALRHDEREHCLRPFLSKCAALDPGATAADVARDPSDNDAESLEAATDPSDQWEQSDEWERVTRAGWCGCMRHAARPCARLAAAHPPQPGAYVPSCDVQGYFLPRQCVTHGGHATHATRSHLRARRCWCVDRGGQPRACRKREEADDGAPPADDEDAAATAGSGDGEIGY